MKIRLDFVTNSSSSAFVALLIKSSEVVDQIRSVTKNTKNMFKLFHGDCCGWMEINADTVYLLGEAEELLPLVSTLS